MWYKFYIKIKLNICKVEYQNYFNKSFIVTFLFFIYCLRIYMTSALSILKETFFYELSLLRLFFFNMLGEAAFLWCLSNNVLAIRLECSLGIFIKFGEIWLLTLKGEIEVF